MHPRRAALLRSARAGAWPHGTSRLLACRKGGCVAARDRRLLACRKGGCVAAQDEPPSCVPQGRVRGRTGQAAFLRTARAGAWPHGTSRLLACGKGGSSGIFAWWGPLSVRLAAGRSCPFLGLVAAPREGAVPPSIPSKGGSAPWTPEGGKCPPYPPLTGRVRDRTGQAALLPAARAGGCTPGEPPSCVPQGRKASYCSQAEPREREETTHTPERQRAALSAK